LDGVFFFFYHSLGILCLLEFQFQLLQLLHLCLTPSSFLLEKFLGPQTIYLELFFCLQLEVLCCCGHLAPEFNVGILPLWGAIPGALFMFVDSDLGHGDR
jgi:hypothetical protein